MTAGTPSARPLSIALMIETGGPGGAEHLLLHLAESLRARGHQLCPVSPDNRLPWLADSFRERGFEPALVSPRRAVDPGVVRDLVRILRRRQVEVVHSHEFDMAVYGAAAAALLHRPHVITMHGGRYYAGRWTRRAALRWAARRSHAFVGVSASVVADLERTLRLSRGSARVVHNGVRFEPGRRDRVRAELGVEHGEQVVVAVGSLYPVKGHIVLLRALATVDLMATPWRLAIAGRGGEEGALRAFAAEHGITDRVHILGYRSDVSDILAAADIYAMPSLSEGLPLGLLEAMFAGKAIVASDVGGIPEAVAAGREALLVPPGDHAALAATLRCLLADPAQRARLGAAAKARVASAFDLERMTDAYEQIYRGALSRR
jgi:glycosyltransferase involved in cell wall biosynthesis